MGDYDSLNHCDHLLDRGCFLQLDLAGDLQPRSIPEVFSWWEPSPGSELAHAGWVPTEASEGADCLPFYVPLALVVAEAARGGADLPFWLLSVLKIAAIAFRRV